MARMRFDLHVHSAASDGLLRPQQLIRAALSAKLSALAITDHDSVHGVPEAIDAARGTDLFIIPGVELSASWNGTDVHILGYFVNPHDRALCHRLSQLRKARITRARNMVKALRKTGIEVTLEDVLHFAGEGSVGRSHIARALVSRGHVKSVTEAFKNLIGHGQPYYLPKPVAHPVDVVKIIIEAGGVPVLAHPGITAVDDSIPILVKAGLAGLEAYHGEHTYEQRLHYCDLARKHNLIVTGGSDFHGPDTPGCPLGGVKMPDSVLEDLYAAGKRILRA